MEFDKTALPREFAGQTVTMCALIQDGKKFVASNAVEVVIEDSAVVEEGE